MKLPYKSGNRVQITSAFGYRTNPINNTTGEFHSGLDLVGLDDKTVCAPVDGVVAVSQIVTDKTNRTWEWGNYIAIAGDDGLIYYMCHLSERLVKDGQKVKAGDVIGIEGSTGYSTGSHCHFEVRGNNGIKINPAERLGIDNVSGTVITIEEEKPAKELDNIPADWAKEAVEWAVDTGILKGDENGDLMLRGNVTREQMIVFLHRFFKKYI